MKKYCVILFLIFFGLSGVVYSQGGVGGDSQPTLGDSVKIPPPIEGVTPPRTDNVIQTLEQTDLKIQTSAGNVYDFRVEVADSEKERRIGMMFRRDVPEGTGMLFLFEDNVERRFWMKNTFVPLDIIFIRDDGVIVNITHNATPHSLKLLESGAKAKAALEIAGGEARRKNINIGDRIIYESLDTNEGVEAD